MPDSHGSDTSSQEPIFEGIIPCDRPEELMAQVKTYAEELLVRAHTIGSHGLDEDAFYASEILDGAIEKLRGRKSATMAEKRDFIRLILNFLQDRDHISEWEKAGGSSRHDYEVRLTDGSITAIEAKGCLDGNNTNIWERPSNANEFVIWSICQNKSSDIGHNMWSGIATRLVPTIITQKEVVDGVVMWDFFCGTPDRPCPKLRARPEATTDVGQHTVPPPCLYVFPATVPEPFHNPKPPMRGLTDVKFLDILHRAFLGGTASVHAVEIELQQREARRQRKTKILRDGEVVCQNPRWATIKRMT